MCRLSIFYRSSLSPWQCVVSPYSIGPAFHPDNVSAYLSIVYRFAAWVTVGLASCCYINAKSVERRHNPFVCWFYFALPCLPFPCLALPVFPNLPCLPFAYLPSLPFLVFPSLTCLPFPCLPFPSLVLPSIPVLPSISVLPSFTLSYFPLPVLPSLLLSYLSFPSRTCVTFPSVVHIVSPSSWQVYPPPSYRVPLAK